MSNTPSIHPDVRIGHVHLKVADLDRSLAFYCGVLGFQLTQRYGRDAAFISAGGYHHHIGLNTWESLGGSPPPPSSTGLYHLAILYPTRAELADALTRLIKAGIMLDGASDHGVSEALYLAIPITTVSNSTGIARPKSGLGLSMAQWKCLRARSISTAYSLKQSLKAEISGAPTKTTTLCLSV
jgi:catechol 2,3-dioxygenase-like lactoylglutathione lyase family enzyme